MSRKQTILLTGASSGIGKATALKLAREGHTVYAAARRVENMEDLKEAGIRSLKMDITKEDDLQRVVDVISKECQGVDVLVNNAGYAVYGAMEDTSLEDARNQFDVNLFGLARLTQLVLPYMREKKRGKIVNLSSVGGKIYSPLGSWYHATKHALEGWSDSLRLELKPFNIVVIIIEPGLIATEFGDAVVSPMVQRSGDGPYQKMVQATIGTFKVTYEQKKGSPASLIATVISKSIAASRPKTRYVAGKYAKPLMFIRKYLGDKIFDKIILFQVRYRLRKDK